MLRLYGVEYTLALIAVAPACIPWWVLSGSLSRDVFTARHLKTVCDPETWILVGHSAALAGIVAVVSLLLATGFLVLLWRIKSGALRSVLLMAAALLFCLSPVIQLAGWQMVLFFDQLPPLPAASLVLSWHLFPISAFLLTAGMFSMEKAAIEAAATLCPPGHVFRAFVLPHLYPVFCFSGLLTAMLAFIQIEVPGLLGFSGYPELFLSRIILEDDRGLILMQALPFVVTALPVTGLLMRLRPGKVDNAWQKDGHAVLDDLMPGLNHPGVATLGVVLLLLMPVLMVFRIPAEAAVDTRNVHAVVTSLKLAIFSVAPALILAYLITDGVFRLPPLPRTMAMGFFCVQILMPGPLLGLAMVDVSLIEGFECLQENNLLLLMTHALRLMPYGVLLTAAFRWMKPSLKGSDEIKLLGVSWFRRTMRLQLPCEWRWLALTGGIMLVIILSELSTTILTVSPGTETAILKLYNLLHYGAYQTVFELALLQTLMVVTMMSVLLWCLRRMLNDPH